MGNLVTLGRSDAILVCSIIELMLQADLTAQTGDAEEAEDLLQFIRVQLNSIAEEGGSTDIRLPDPPSCGFE